MTVQWYARPGDAMVVQSRRRGSAETIAAFADDTETARRDIEASPVPVIILRDGIHGIASSKEPLPLLFRPIVDYCRFPVQVIETGARVASDGLCRTEL